MALAVVTASVMLASFTLELYHRTSFRASRLLELERAKSERLLLDILPASIAERLKARPDAIGLAPRRSKAGTEAASRCAASASQQASGVGPTARPAERRPAGQRPFAGGPIIDTKRPHLAVRIREERPAPPPTRGLMAPPRQTGCGARSPPRPPSHHRRAVGSCRSRGASTRGSSAAQRGSRRGQPAEPSG